MRKTLTFAAAVAASLALGAPQASAAWKPDGPIKMMIGFGAGGMTDTLGRLIAEAMKKQTGWEVVVLNKPGGGGVAMFSNLMNAKPDGRTIGVGVNVPILLQLTVRPGKLPFKIDSFDYLGTIVRAQLAIVAKADAPFDDMASFIAHARKTGTAPAVAYDAKPQQLLMSAVSKQAKLKMRLVPHKSGAQVIQTLLGGNAAIGFVAGVHIPYVKAGKLKIIASANKTRHTYAPKVKTLIEQGYNYYVDPYFYVAGPKGLPADARAALAGALKAAIASPTVTKFLANTMKTTPDNLGPAGTTEMLTGGLKDVGILIRAAK